VRPYGKATRDKKVIIFPLPIVSRDHLVHGPMNRKLVRKLYKNGANEV
jgi:hypothetical protein